jgi:tagaturonate epimerase
MRLDKYSFGVGDRFGHQGKAQLQAIINAEKHGINIAPVWNKSHREHTIIKTVPSDVRTEADEAVKSLGWDGSYYVDADHIGLKNVDLFIDSSDFFTIDVAEFINKAIDENEIADFVKKHDKYLGCLKIPGIDKAFETSKEQVEAIAREFLPAIKQAGKIYRHIEAAKGVDTFITEVSMDETSQPQTPVKIFFILAAIADEDIPAQTIAPKFTGCFNKGVDYVGDVALFAKGFEECLAIITFAVKEFSLPENLKISVHSGSDKFSIYKSMNKSLRKFDAGVHIKTSGTTWLEELIGLAIAGGEGLSIAKQIYAEALSRFDELCEPYAAVVDIDKDKLPSPEVVNQWSSTGFADALRHNQSCDKYNPDFRQLLHVAYKIAAEMGIDYLNVLEKYERIISQNVMKNIYERHIKPIFMG